MDSENWHKMGLPGFAAVLLCYSPSLPTQCCGVGSDHVLVLLKSPLHLEWSLNLGHRVLHALALPALPASSCLHALHPLTPLLSLYSSSNRLYAFPTGESLLESCLHGSLPVFRQGLLKASLPYRPSGSSCQNPPMHPVFPLQFSLCLQLFFWCLLSQ